MYVSSQGKDIVEGRRMTSDQSQGTVVTQIRELSLQTPNVGYNGNALEVVKSYSRGHHSLEPLLDNLVDQAGRDAAVRFFKKLGIDDPGEYGSPHELFRSTISLIATGDGKTRLRAWAVAEQSLGNGTSVLVILIDHPVMPMSLVCCRVGPGTYLAYYADESVPDRLLGAQVLGRQEEREEAAASGRETS